ncbi:hypothetical protein N658DRAFT_146970 [Parathielavia hyrcaniae]|uniref:F-box domain-containing protein n=1 Tax=Parathielavia hyrcaniae TaxID=113614 RepID=A0AAN6SZT5_9PEZI|nr:hypothetical protein N658DRAFT_146970 [Parathielavia hyrcaniae]
MMGDEERHFPLHLACLELVSFCLTGSRGLSIHKLSLDKDALYLALFCLRSHPMRCRVESFQLVADSKCKINRWYCLSGYEFLVANPGLPDSNSSSEPTPVTSYLKTILPPIQDRQSETAADLPSRVKVDLFSRLPIELLFRIGGLLNDPSLSAWCAAFWTLHSVLHANNRFWRHRITRVSMLWLQELVPLLDDEELMSRVDVRKLFHQLHTETLPKPNITGPAMSLANRRRIWEACGVIGRAYDEMVREKAGLGTSLVRAKLLSEASPPSYHILNHELSEGDELWEAYYLSMMAKHV